MQDVMLSTLHYIMEISGRISVGSVMFLYGLSE